jgi:AcrR family transcriptional regulator
MMNRKKMERESKRRFVADAARSLFAEKGIENATMEDIAILSGYTRRTLYSYFKSFDEICLEVLLDDQAIRWSAQKEAVAAADTGLAKWRAWAESLYGFARENPQYIRLEMYWDYRGLNPRRIGRGLFRRFAARNDELADGLRDIFRLGTADGSMRSDLEADLCISQFLYSFRGIVNRAISPGYSFAAFDADDYVKHYLDLFDRAIRKKGSAKK